MPVTPVTRDTVYFYKFNNYYNRIIKRYDTIAEYTANATLLGKQENCNFVHGDGVNSSFTWNRRHVLIRLNNISKISLFSS